MIELLVEIREDEVREKLVLGAWAAFQLGAGGEAQKFGQYLQKLGLQETKADEPQGGERSGDLTSEQALKKAEDILAMARRKEEAE